MSRKRRPAAERRRDARARMSAEATRVLVIDEDAAFCSSLRRLLTRRGCATAVTRDLDHAGELLASFQPDVILIDLRLEGSGGGRVLERFGSARPDLLFVVTGQGRGGKAARAALRRGAYDYLDKSAAREERDAILRRAFDKRDMNRSLRALLADSDGREQALLEARIAAERAAQEARTAHARLVDAFEVVPEGLVLFDAEDRLVMWNRRYAEICELVGDKLVVGMRFEDLLRGRLERACIPDTHGDREGWVAERLASHRALVNRREQELPGNHWLRIEERRTADGGTIGVRVDITELKRREASFRLLFEGNPAPMWIYERKTLRFLAVNDAALEHYGYSREQFLGMTLLDIRVREEWDDLLRNNQRETTHSQGGRTRRHVRADRSLIDVTIFSRSIAYEGREARLVAIVDLTSRKRAEDELRRTREFLHAVIETVPTEIVVKDARDLRYVLVNHALEQRHRRPREELIGRTSSEVFAPHIAKMIEDYDRSALRRRTAQFSDAHVIETPIMGTRIVNSVRHPIFGDDGEPKYLVTVIHDITERRQAEERVAHMAYHDTLTDLPNRVAFNEHFAATLPRTTQAGGTFGVLR